MHIRKQYIVCVFHDNISLVQFFNYPPRIKAGNGYEKIVTALLFCKIARYKLSIPQEQSASDTQHNLNKPTLCA